LTSAETAICISVVGRACCNTAVSRGNHDGRSLQTELHELVALPLLVARREIVFLFTIADADNVGWLVGTALALSFVTIEQGIRIHRVYTGVASLAVGTVCTV